MAVSGDNSKRIVSAVAATVVALAAGTNVCDLVFGWALLVLRRLLTLR